jgi:hypothetical protein
MAMAVPLKNVLERVSSQRRAAIEADARQMIAEEQALSRLLKNPAADKLLRI